jgi:hypothetical protein
MKKLLLATAFVIAGTVAHAQDWEGAQRLNKQCAKMPKLSQAKAQCFYGTTDHEFFNSPDQYAHSRSVEHYRSIVGYNTDTGGFCRNAAHIRECLAAFNDGRFGRPANEPVDQKTVLEQPERAGWVKSTDVECDIHDECNLVDNYTDVSKKGGACAMFAIPVYDRPNGKIVGSLVVDILVKRNSQRGGFTHVKSRGIGNDVSGFSECG